MISPINNSELIAFPIGSIALERFGLKFSAGGTHISRTMMLAELGSVLAAVPVGASSADYKSAILQLNVLCKTTDSTRKKSLRHLRELYALDENVPIFRLLRTLQAFDIGASLPLLALQVAWSRDPLFRSTTQPVLYASVGEKVDREGLVQALAATFPDQYSEASVRTATQNAASSWTQSGHLVGHVIKIRRQVKPTPVAVTMALFLGQVAGSHGAAVFSSPWVRLLDLDADRARALAQEAHRLGLLNLRSVGEVFELSFPLLAGLQGITE
ncbi:MAG: hypothetical protein IPO08_09130 [Xanthomonadales bacterium]|nr:hypothetical protein [Xanthomonadales bacterium]